MSKLKKHRGIEALKSRYGWYFCGMWAIGLLLFFVFPLIQSILYVFSDVKLEVGGINLSFVGLKNIKNALFVNSDYTNNLGKSIGELCYTLPAVLVISLILGIMLNSQFKGRIIFRVLYFLPVIIASGAVIKLLLTYQSGNITDLAQDESVSNIMIDVSSIVAFTGLPSQISGYINSALSGIMNIIWNCGVQIVLFIAGMQTIPDLLYEVSKVEGATKWEEFWFITVPSLSQVTVLVIVYTVVELITSQKDKVLLQAYTFMQSQKYGEASAMLWMYFLIVGSITGLLLWAYRHFCARKWE